MKRKNLHKGGDRISRVTPCFGVLVLLLLFPMLACGLINPIYQENNAIRQAVFEYERGKYGPVDDLVIHFNRDEPRIRFDRQHQDGGRTVWLYSFGAREFFDTRPAQASYLYIQEIQYDETRRTATVKVYRGKGTGYQGRQLVVTRSENGNWSVTGEAQIENEQ